MAELTGDAARRAAELREAATVFEAIGAVARAIATARAAS